MLELKSCITHGLNLNWNRVPANFITKGFLTLPRQFNDAPGFAVPMSTLRGTMSSGCNPILAAKLLEMQQPALFPEFTNAEQGILETITGMYEHVFIIIWLQI